MGPGNDTHGALGPLRRKAVGGPTPTPQMEKSRCDDASPRQHNTHVFRQTNLDFIFIFNLTSFVYHKSSQQNAVNKNKSLKSLQVSKIRDVGRTLFSFEFLLLALSVDFFLKKLLDFSIF